MSCKWLEWIRRLGVIVRKEKVSDPVIQGVVETAFALEGIAFAKGAGLEQELDKFIVATETSLEDSQRLSRLGFQRVEVILGIPTRIKGV